ncbi:MAG: hypothetical protein M1833_005296 [Piccolia ochrophora]|nr:MAG: hypothetical protein M1833_005296 [Piccolia ochrophora]
MSRQRSSSMLDGQKEPHSVSLKVLRLSRPSLATQSPLPNPTSDTVPEIPARASSAGPTSDLNDAFVFTPLLTLPPAFGSAYVGEAFSCTLCANNELPQSDTGRLISSIRIAAEMQTPSQTVPLTLASSDETSKNSSLEHGQSLQKIVRFDLKEEGSHVLAVTVTYTETSMAKGDWSSTGTQAASGRVRTFRKLYQFLAQQCLAVRTKTAELLSGRVIEEDEAVNASKRLLRFILEAQLENMGEASITLETVHIAPKVPFQSVSLNWDTPSADEKAKPLPILNPRDVLQVAFLIEQEKDSQEDPEALGKKGSREAARVTLGQLCIEWRSAMGDKGFLSTGWLTSRRK